MSYKIDPIPNIRAAGKIIAFGGETVQASMRHEYPSG